MRLAWIVLLAVEVPLLAGMWVIALSGFANSVATGLLACLLTAVVTVFIGAVLRDTRHDL